MNTKAYNYVMCGANELDFVKPRWWEKVNLGTLDLCSIDYDILGQVFGTTAKSMQELALDSYVELTVRGFKPGFRCNAVELQYEWKKVIEDRRKNMPNDAASSVAAGVAYLDANVPDWRSKVTITNFTVHSATNCPVGQIYGGYMIGKNKLRLTMEEAFELGLACKCALRKDCETDKEWKKVLLGEDKITVYLISLVDEIMATRDEGTAKAWREALQQSGVSFVYAEKVI